MSSWKIARLKNNAKRAYKRYHNELDGLSCGKHMGEFINPRMREAKLEFNSILDELAKLDPNCPKTRL